MPARTPVTLTNLMLFELGTGLFDHPSGIVPLQGNKTFWPWKPIHWWASMSNDAVSGIMLLGRPQTLTMGGFLAGASLAGNSWNITQETKKREL